MAKEDVKKDNKDKKTEEVKKETPATETKAATPANTASLPAPVPTSPAPGTPTVSPKPKKRHSCLIIFLVVLAIYIILQFVPIFGMGLFGNFADTYVPPLNINANTNSTVAVTNSNQNTNAVSSKTKNTNSTKTTTTSKPLTETPSTPADQPPAGTTGPQTSFTKQQEIDYFIKIALTDESHNYQETPLHRWTYPTVSIKYIGNFSNPSDLACANDTISILNSLSTSTHFVNDQNDGLYKEEVHFVPHSEIAAVAGDAGGYMNYDVLSNGAFSHTYAYVPIDTYSDSVRCHFIRHEMTHASTGLIYNLTFPEGGYHYSIFNVPVEGWSDYINIDKDLIKMMYNTGITTNSTAAQARAFLNGASW